MAEVWNQPGTPLDSPDAMGLLERLLGGRRGWGGWDHWWLNSPGFQATDVLSDFLRVARWEAGGKPVCFKC
jgi:hypothetical protein